MAVVSMRCRVAVASAAALPLCGCSTGCGWEAAQLTQGWKCSIALWDSPSDGSPECGDITDQGSQSCREVNGPQLVKVARAYHVATFGAQRGRVVLGKEVRMRVTAAVATHASRLVHPPQYTYSIANGADNGADDGFGTMVQLLHRRGTTRWTVPCDFIIAYRSADV
eukprot:gene32292-biopygen100669